MSTAPRQRLQRAAVAVVLAVALLALGLCAIPQGQVTDDPTTKEATP